MANLFLIQVFPKDGSSLLFMSVEIVQNDGYINRIRIFNQLNTLL